MRVARSQSTPVPSRTARRLTAVLAIAVTVGIAIGVGASDVSASSGEPDDSTAAALVERFAPIVLLRDQPGSCSTDGEAYVPMSVDPLLGNPQIALRQRGRGDPVVMWGPEASDLYGLGEGFYLDFPGEALSPGCVYEQDFDRSGAAATPTIYANVATQADRPDRIAVQYWFWWYYNDWNDKHEGDWEFVQVLLPASSIAEALEVDPIGVGYAQHSGGERADWDDERLTREGDRIVVHPSVGSHASYFSSAVFLGRSGHEGFGCDDTDDPTTRLDPEIVLIPTSVDGPDDPFAWVAFEGRWGERQPAPNSGPTGPATKDQWTAPVDWFESLRTSSFVIPGGDGPASQLIDAFCGVVEWGSLRALAIQDSPLQAFVLLALIVLVVRFLVRRTSWAEVPSRPLVRPRRAGEVLRLAVRLHRRHLRLLTSIATLSLPLAAFAALLGAVIHRVPIVGDMVTTFDSGGESTLIVSLLVGGIAAAICYVAVVAAVSWTLGELADGRRPTARQAFAAVRSRMRPLAVGFGIAALVVVVLQLTVIATPVVVYLLVSWQLLAPVVMLEQHAGADALRRSGRLLRGRWWRTAVVLTGVGLVTGVIGLAVGLVLLVVVPGLPLWFLSAVVTAVNVLVLPFGGIVTTYLYGDAVAAEASRHDSEPDAGSPAMHPVDA